MWLYTIAGMKNPLKDLQHSAQVIENLQTILLVDDSFENNYLTKYILKLEGINVSVQEVNNGKQALDYIRVNGFPDVIFLDICMPQMDGFEFLLALKAMHVPVQSKIFILSSSIYEWEIEKFVETGLVADYFEKPFEASYIPVMLQKIAAKN